MARTLSQKLKTLPVARRSKIEERAAELIEEELSLRDLRKALDRTQVEVAKKMGVGQDTISRYEQQADMMLSTLERYVSAMGGRLRLVAEFPDRKPVRMRAFSDFSDERAEVPAGVLSKRSERSVRRPSRRRRT
jgi:transcriptional regulator with XRE-family HTH domain